MARTQSSESSQKSTSLAHQFPQSVMLVSVDDIELLLERVVRRVLSETGSSRIPADDLLTVYEAAKLLKCHPSTIGRWAKSGQIDSLTRGRRRYYSRELLIAFRDGATATTTVNPLDN